MLAWRFGWCDQQASFADEDECGARPAPGGPLCGAVGDQASDRQVGLLEDFTASGKAPQGCPLPQLGVGVLDTDPG